MSILVATFLIVGGIIFGAYWMFILRPEEQESTDLRKRLKKGSAQRQAMVELLNKPERLSDLGALDRGLTRVSGLLGPLQRTVAQSGLEVTVGTVLLACAVTGLVAYALVAYVSGLPLVGLLAAVVACYVPILVIRFMRNRRMLKFEEQFPEAIDLLARALRAGHALTTGLSMVAEEAPKPVGPEFKVLFDQQNYGLPLPQALKNFADRIPTLDARFFVTAVLTQREAGGNLSEVLDNLASVIRDRFRVKRQVRVISAHGRITGWILSALPTGLALFFAASSPEKYATFYRDPFGMKMIFIALGLQVVGVFIISRIVKIEY